VSAGALTLTVPPALVDAIAERVAERLEPQLAAAGAGDPWVDVDQAAAYLACKPQRIHDLVSQERLRPDGRDGRRLLFRRSALDAYVQGAVEAA
jgi:excisionase family DNA binding protein